MASISCLALAILTFTSILLLINCEQISSQDIFDSIEPKSGRKYKYTQLHYDENQYSLIKI